MIKLPIWIVYINHFLFFFISIYIVILYYIDFNKYVLYIIYYTLRLVLNFIFREICLRKITESKKINQMSSATLKNIFYIILKDISRFKPKMSVYGKTYFKVYKDHNVI